MKRIALPLVSSLVLAALLLSACTLPYRGTATPIAQPGTGTAESPETPDAGGSVATDTGVIGKETQPAAPAPATATPAPVTATAVPPTATLVPAAPTAVPAAPTNAAPAAPANAARVEFQAGSTSTVIRGEMNTGETESYLLKANSGQTMRVEVWSPNGNVYLGISGLTDGKVLLASETHSARYEGVLPATQDYLFQAVNGNGLTSYSITISIPASGSLGPVPTASAADFDPYKELGEPKMIDQMNGGNRAAWVDSDGDYPDTDEIEIYLKDSATFVTGKNVGWSTWWYSWPELSDFYLELTVNSGTCAGKDAYGLILRGPAHQSGDAHGYVVSFSCDGYYRVFRLDSVHPYTTVTLVDWTKNEFINAGADQRNILGVKAEGKTLVVYANGHKVVEINDATYLEGRYGLFVASENTRNYTYRAMKMAYWLLTGKR